MPVTIHNIRSAIQSLGVSDQSVCIHASLRSFGYMEGGAQAIVEAFLDEGCTLMAPTFTWDTYATHAPGHLRPKRNGTDDAYLDTLPATDRIYTTDASEIDTGMGAVPAAVLAMADHVRGDHPLCSFTAVGPLARDLVVSQAPERVYGPLERLTELHGFVILMGVDLTSLTLIHLAERQAGRRLFRRWANDRHGQPMMVEAGGCSGGFGNLDPYLAPFLSQVTVGQSLWLCYPATETLAAAAAAIRTDPMIVHCDNPNCGRCNDGAAGGPIPMEEENFR